MKLSLRHHLAVPALVCAAALAGCASPAPRYQPLIDNVEVLKRAPAPVAIGAFSVKSGAVGTTSIGLRGSSMISPVGQDYAAYLADALQQELELAGKLGAKSNIEISGVLLKNDISAAGLSTNSGEVQAQFVVKKDGAVKFDKVKRGELSWESSFAGAIAIPKARQQYPLIVQQLLAQMMTDPEFSAALK